MHVNSILRVRWMLALVLVCGTHFAIAIDWGLAGSRSLAPDEITPRRVAIARQREFANGWHDYYPPLMFYAAAASHAVSDAIVAKSAESSKVFRRRSLAARSISAAAALITVLALFALGRRMGLGAGAAIAALLWAASPTVTYYAKTSNVESLYLMLLLLALVLLARALEEGSAGWLAGAGVLAAAAAATKDQAAVYGLFAGISLFPLHGAPVGERRALGATIRAIGGRRLVVAGAIALAAYLCFLNVPFNFEGVRRHFEALRKVASLSPEFDLSAAGKLAQAWQTVVNLHFLLGLPALLLALWGLRTIARDGQRRKRHWFHLPAAIGYALFMWLAVPRAYDRFLLPIVISAVLVAGEGAAELLSRFRHRPRIVVTLLAGALLLSGARAVELDLRLLFDSRDTIGEWIARDGGSTRTTWVLGKHDWAATAGRQVALGTPPYFVQQLVRWKPRHLVAEAQWSRSRRWSGVLQRAGYEEVHRDAGRISARLSRHGAARTNLDKISPELVVYRRTSTESSGERSARREPS